MENNNQKKHNNEFGRRGYRPIDDKFEDIMSWLKKSYVFMKKTEIKTWKFVLIISFVAGFAAAVISLVSLDMEQESRASIVPAKMFFSPVSANINEGSQFNVDINLDSMGGNLVVAKADVTYNTASLQLLGWNTAESVFSTGNSCMYNSKPCEIIENDSTNGRLSIALAKPSPGVSSSGKVATLTFKALKPINASTSELKINFLGQGRYDDADLILDDGSGTDTLSSVGNFSLNVSSVDIAAPVISNGSPTGELPSSISVAKISVQTNEKSSCKYSKTLGVDYSSMTSLLDSTDSMNHFANLSGLTSATRYDYYVRCQDLSGNKNTSDYNVSFSVAPKIITTKIKGSGRRR